MYRIKKHRILLSVGLVWVIFLAGILLADHEKEYDKDAGRFAAVVSSGGYYWEDIEAGIKKADQEFGTYTKYIKYERFDEKEQIEMLEKADYMNVEGIITIGQPGSGKVNEMIKRFQKKGVPVVLIDTDDRRSGRNCYIGVDNYAVGKLAAEQIARASEQKAKVLVVASKLDSDNQQIRLDGFSDAIEQYEDMEIVSVIEVEKEKTTIDEKVKEAFLQWDGINAVFCLEPSNTTQVGYALESDKKYADVIAVGIGINASTLEFIKNGTFFGIIKLNGAETGYEAVRYLYEAKETENSEYYSSLVFVDKNNIEELQETDESE